MFLIEDFFFTEIYKLQLFIELCDGWYPIKAQCDAQLTNQFKNGKIIVGDKLALFGCEMNGPQDGFHPLEV